VDCLRHVADITYIATREGWLYQVVLGLFAQRVVGLGD
jgi:transposase InsO family protein